MQASFIAVLITAIVFSIFAILNAKPVSVNLLFASYELSQAIVILVSASLGAFLMFLLNIVQNIKLKREIKQLNSKLTTTMNNYMNVVNAQQNSNNNQAFVSNSQFDSNINANQIPADEGTNFENVNYEADETEGNE